MDGWDSCSVCAGRGGDGPGTDHGLQQHIGTPSLSGSSSQFSAGGVPWGAALWWKQVGGNDDVNNLHYSLDFYMENPGAAQALEFDVNQNAGGLRYIFGTECDIKDTGTWRVWDSQPGNWGLHRHSLHSSVRICLEPFGMAIPADRRRRALRVSQSQWANAKRRLLVSSLRRRRQRD